MMQADIERVLFITFTLLVSGAALAVARRRGMVWLFAVGGVLLLSAVAELVTPGRALFGQQPFLAGSGLTRMVVLEVGAVLRRALEPWTIALTLALSWGALLVGGRAAWLLVCAVVSFCLLRAGECVLLSQSPPEWLAALSESGVPTGVGVLGLVAIGAALRLDCAGEVQKGRLLTVICIAHTAILAVVVSAEQRSTVAVGAHYYSWFPENWAASYIGEKLVPPVVPLLGEYDSSDPAVFDKHVEWAEEAGIEFFIFDWWAKRHNVRRRVLQQAESLDRRGGVRFALHFEALDLKERKDTPVPGEDSNVVVMTPERADRLKRQWEYLAKHYMLRPSYLRERGAAVLFVYATRHLVGPVREAMDAARRHVRDQTGVELFVVGDEVYFNALRYDAGRGVYLLGDGEPDWDRVLAFDALPAYNPYDESRPHHGGEGGAERFLDDVDRLYARYRGIAATAGLRFIPTVLPGYNDRGVRPNEDHFVIPRWIEGGSFFERSLVRLGSCRFSGESGLVVVTSWNEWNEGTQIEPTAASMLTSEDVSGTNRFSQGALLGGYANQHLLELRSFSRSCQ